MAELDPRAFSQDRYIINQERTGALRYGAYASNYNGCGWIAAYNFMLAMGRPLPYRQVCGELAAGSPHNGRMGTGPRRLRAYLEGKGYTVDATVLRRKARARAATARAGIILYLSGVEPHFVTFVAQPEGGFRFLNAVPGDARHVMSLSDFLKRYTHHLPVYIMTAS